MIQDENTEIIQYLKEKSNGSENDIQFFLCWDILESMKKTALFLKDNESTIEPIEFYTKLKKIFTGFEITRPMIKQQFQEVKKLFS